MALQVTNAMISIGMNPISHSRVEGKGTTGVNQVRNPGIPANTECTIQTGVVAEAVTEVSFVTAQINGTGLNGTIAVKGNPTTCSAQVGFAHAGSAGAPGMQPTPLCFQGTVINDAAADQPDGTT